MKHLDLFSGIGGFAYALDQVFYDRTIEHIFCDNNRFAQAVLKKHWPTSEIYGDIRELNKLIENGIIDLCNGNAHNAKNDQSPKDDLIVNPAIQSELRNGDQKTQRLDERQTTNGRGEKNMKFTIDTEENVNVVGKQKKRFSRLTIKTVAGTLKEKNIIPKRGNSSLKMDTQIITKSSALTATTQNITSEYAHTTKIDFLTGGFPCQPFSQAGKRRGTEDERYLWKEMFRTIQLTKPKWVVAENVRGFATWNNGLVLEQVCTDLESLGYEVQPFIIPACAVNAPHRRDRIWIVANRPGERSRGSTGEECRDVRGRKLGQKKFEGGQVRGESERRSRKQNASYSGDERLERSGSEAEGHRRQFGGKRSDQGADWDQNWFEVASELCRLDDGISAQLDGLKFTKAQHRNERLKSYGNAIVPQVAMQIFKAIRLAENI